MTIAPSTLFIRTLPASAVPYHKEFMGTALMLDEYWRERPEMTNDRRRDVARGVVTMFDRLRREAEAMRKEAMSIDLSKTYATDNVMSERRVISNLDAVFRDDGEQVFDRIVAAVEAGKNPYDAVMPKSLIARGRQGIYDLFHSGPDADESRKACVFAALDFIATRRNARTNIERVNELVNKAKVREMLIDSVPRRELLHDAGWDGNEVIHLGDRSARRAKEAR